MEIKIKKLDDKEQIDKNKIKICYLEVAIVPNGEVFCWMQHIGKLENFGRFLYEEVKDEKTKQSANEQFQYFELKELEKYKKIQQIAWEEYNKIEQSAWRKYDKIEESACKKYHKIKKTSWEKYLKTEQPAWKEYCNNIKNKIKELLTKSENQSEK